jgi:hypothetical protein
MPGAALNIRLASAPKAAQSKVAKDGSPVTIKGSAMKRWRRALMRSAGVRPCRTGSRQQQEQSGEQHWIELNRLNLASQCRCDINAVLGAMD